MANSVDPDQTAPSGAVWSGSTPFAYVILSDALVFEFLGHLAFAVCKHYALCSKVLHLVWPKLRQFLDTI